MNNDLISREALNDIWELYKQYQPRLATNVYEFGEALRELIDNAPTVANERPQGEWIGKEEYDDYPNKMVCECSECGKMICVSHNDFPNFCENCGADMRKGGAE